MPRYYPWYYLPLAPRGRIWRLGAGNLNGVELEGGPGFLNGESCRVDFFVIRVLGYACRRAGAALVELCPGRFLQALCADLSSNVLSLLCRIRINV